MKHTHSLADQRYINQVLALALNQANQAQDPYRPVWHFAPLFGLLNDPNGLAHFNGEYHLFYQWNPKACAHGAKAWGHATSKDLFTWQHQPLALAPTQDYETHGCYSGSGLVVDDTLELFYTGNVKFAEGGRTAYQCRASLEAGKQVEKKGIVLSLPDGYSGHVRDPKVWVHQERYYMVLGAEDLNYQGKVLAFVSDDLENWHWLGEVFGNGLNGYHCDDFMLECPDLFPLENRHVLITCPKNWLERDGKKVETFDVTYHIGDFDYQTAAFNHQDGVLMDHGFDFYAPQTFADQDGRRILFGWMGKPDEYEAYQPSIQHGWIHQMTCPRELTLVNGRLKQNPVMELTHMRQHQQVFKGLSTCFDGLSGELQLHNLQNEELLIEIADDLRIEVDSKGLRTERRNLKNHQWQVIEWPGRVNSLQLLRDHSSLEMFINEGEAVATSRFFGKGFGAKADKGFKLSSKHELSAIYWQLVK